MTVIINYGAGNVGSVEKAVRFVGSDAIISDRAEDIRRADKVILPGVGAFGATMQALSAHSLEPVIKEYISSDRPFLGICLGLQALFDSSEETPGCPGLSVFGGKILRIPSDGGLKVPHIGWNSISINTECPLFKGVPDQSYVYFVHSFYLHADDESIVSATTQYGVNIHAAIWSGNCFATQFHPEKSGEVGLAMLKNFISL